MTDHSGNITKAIQDVQRVINVIDAKGYTFVYFHNGDKMRLKNILECLKELESLKEGG